VGKRSPGVARLWRPGLVGRRVAVPTVRRIIVGVHGSLGSLQALRYAADEARQRNVPLVAVIAWIPPGGDLAERRQPSPYLRKIWRDAAWEQLWAAFDAGLGGVPADLHVEPQVVRGETGPVLVDTADQPDDLLVIGTGRRGVFGRMVRRSVGRYCLAHARCPVLAVPPSALLDEMSHPLHSWHIRRHELLPDSPDT
jgi:nucleotide-binding universal stress UspA family protein